LSQNKLLALCGTLVLGGTLLLGQAAQEQPQQVPAKPSASGQTSGSHVDATHTHAAAAKILNPVKPNESSIAAGQQLYGANCATCHGPKGAGDGVQASKFAPRPSNLVDVQWKHGPSDGEIFTVIRNGVPKTSMSSFAKKMTERQTWDIVNFVRSLGPKNESHTH
jgi:mono/diheme cytochrome c family protein